MRLLHACYSYYPYLRFGGPPEKVRGLCSELVRRGHQVAVLTSRPWPSLRSEHQVRDGVDVTYLGCVARYRSSFTLNPRLVSYCRHQLRTYDVAHVYGTNDFLGAAVAGFCHHYGVPYVLEPLGMFQSLIRSHRKKMMYRRLVGSRVLHGASHVIATSEQERDELIQLGAPEERVVVRRNGIDLDQLTPVDPPGAFRGSIGVEDGERLIMFLGRLSPIKRLDVLISSFADLKEPNLKLAVVGPDEDGVQAGLSRLATTLGVASRVIFMGPIYGPSKAAAFQDADLFVLPSERESFGNAAAEALAFGTPVVVTEQCGIAPLVGGAGICIGQDGEELTAALRSLLLEEPARLAGMASHTRDVVSGLTWEEPALEMEGHYAAAIRRAP